MGNAWILLPLPGTVTASSTAPGYQPGYVLNDYAGVIWKSVAGATADLIIDLGADTNVDSLLLFGCDGAPAATTLQVTAATAAQGAGFGSTSYAGAAAPLLAGSVMPVNGRGIALWQAPAGGIPVSRYVRLRFAGLGGGQAAVGRLVIGKRIQLERNYGNGGSFGVRDLGSLDFSPRGVLLRRRAAKLRTLTLTFSNIRKDEVEAITKPLLERIGNTEMIGLVVDPAEDPQRQNRCYFGPLVGDLANTRRNAAAWEAKVNLVSLF
ncbi:MULTISPECIES: hypothetical protein [unclassified Sphingomonas]|uniref:hypothetical protein n=1 Tax=unclassified Sphingomonas TaxID=196159 RepID=UPI00226A65B3|nr:MULTISPECIES: hypothetical protein [unclassified Sphingomonas]